MERSALLEPLAENIARVTRPHPVRAAIDGVDGVGKTTLANELVAPLRRRGVPVIRASIDGFHNPRAVRYRLGRSSPEGYFRDSFNYEALKNVLLDPLGPAGHCVTGAQFSTTEPTPKSHPLSKRHLGMRFYSSMVSFFSVQSCSDTGISAAFSMRRSRQPSRDALIATAVRLT